MSFIHGHCGCGALKYKIDISNIDRDLALSAYCHCASCQRLNGAPFVWTSHWEYHAVTWDPPARASSSNDKITSAAATTTAKEEDKFSANMQTFEAMPGQKWKLRCKHCGSPLGSWNAGTTRWTIWPVTIKRTSISSADERGAKNDGDFDVSHDTLQHIRATHHQFYGNWRAMTIHDDLDKWTGYKDKSTQVTSEGIRI